jgi:hypothetical protein
MLTKRSLFHRSLHELPLRMQANQRFSYLIDRTMEPTSHFARRWLSNLPDHCEHLMLKSRFVLQGRENVRAAPR